MPDPVIHKGFDLSTEVFGNGKVANKIPEFRGNKGVKKKNSTFKRRLKIFPLSYSLLYFF